MTSIFDPYDKEKMREWLTLTARPSAKTYAELRDHMLRFIQWHWTYEYRGVTLADLNRRFGKCAKELGTSARQLVEHLFYEKELVEVIHYEKSTVLIDVGYRELLKVDPAAEGISLDEAVLRSAKLKENFLKASLGKP